MNVIVKIALVSVAILNFYFSFSQQENTSTNNIAVIQLQNNKEIRGTLIYEDDDKIIVETGKNKIFEIKRINIRFIKIIDINELKNKNEFENKSINYSQNCFLPTAYITDKDDLFFNSHYSATYNFKLGVAKNFELTAGGVGIAYNYLGVCYSAELFDFLHFGTTVVGSFLISLDGSGDSEFGSIIIPRLSIGNENRNITIGFLGASIQNFNNWIYGGYFGAQRRIHERWTLAGELATINLDTYNYMYVGNVTAKFKRNSAVNWNFGLLGIRFPGLSALFPSDNAFIPLPYVGYSRRF